MYKRQHYLWKDFISAFDGADRVCLLPVYDVAGRETARSKRAVSSIKLAGELQERGKNAWHVDSFDEAKHFLLSQTHRGDIVLIMGAGDIYTLTNEFARDTLKGGEGL